MTKSQGLLFGSFLAVSTLLLLVLFSSALFRSLGTGPELSFSGGSKVGLVLLEGPIVDARPLLEELEGHLRDESVKAVLLRIDSPGGEVAPSQELHDAVARLAKVKPVVVSVGAVAASGAYYAALAADTIVAQPGSLVGSIGVVLSYPTAAELLRKIGVEWRVYKSGPLKDMGTFTRSPSEEEEEIFDAVVADVFDQFVSAVSEDRDLSREEVLSLADGRVFTGRQALEVGLIDRLGGFQAALEVAATLGGLGPEAPVERKARPRMPLWDLLDRVLEENARATWGPRLEYRMR